MEAEAKRAISRAAAEEEQAPDGRWRVPARLRALARREELAVLVLAILAGAVGGAMAAGLGAAAQGLREVLFGLPPNGRLSAVWHIPGWTLALVPAAGGLALGLFNLALARLAPRRRAPVDPVEANALHGGRMSLRESSEVCAQSLISSGSGASVGLEAAYAQAGAGVASRLGQAFQLRRADQRLLVGCGAAGAIAAAFDAPLTGAFYAFELVVGTYAVAGLVPMVGAAVAADLTARALGSGHAHLIAGGSQAPQLGWAYTPFALLLGVLAGLAAIALMRGAAGLEQALRRLRVPGWLAPAMGGAAVGALALLVTPAVLSSGHGALNLLLDLDLPLRALLVLFLAKAAASAICVGAGFRGGLFFASLLLGAVLGRICALAGFWLGLPAEAIEPVMWSLAGMAAFGAGVVGAPLAMTFLVLETTGDFAAGLAVLPAVAAAALTVRRLFGFSFATWRFHLRGETIRSAHDVGWLRDLTAGRLMRRDARTAPVEMTLEAFRAAYPLGAVARVAAVDAAGRYAGLVLVEEAHAAVAEAGAVPPENIGALLRHQNAMLLPQMAPNQAMAVFDAAEAEALVVVDGTETRRVLGLLSEAHLLRRYAEELDQRRRAEAGLP